MEIKVRHFFSEPLCDVENVHGESPVVNGQSLTGAELFRRQSQGLPVGCAIRQFNQVNPYLEKFSIYDSISQFKIRHGMIDTESIEKNQGNSESAQEPSASVEPDKAN